MSFISTNWQIFDDTGRRKYVTDAERARFLAVANSLRPDLRALCHVLTYTGCRISEALALTHDHIDVAASSVTLRTLKRRKLVFRVIPVPVDLTRDLMALSGAQDGRIFCYSRSTAWRHVKRTLQVAGARGPSATCKGLRHGFGIRAAGRSVPINVIQKWLGHSSNTTTAIYLDAVGVEERELAGRMWC